jgi:hypothetical protein
MSSNYIPAVLGEVRGPFTTGASFRPSVCYMVYGHNGWLPFHKPCRHRDEAACENEAKEYAAKLLSEAKQDEDAKI